MGLDGRGGISHMGFRKEDIAKGRKTFLNQWVKRCRNDRGWVSSREGGKKPKA